MKKHQIEGCSANNYPVHSKNVKVLHIFTSCPAKEKSEGLFELLGNYRDMTIECDMILTETWTGKEKIKQLLHSWQNLNMDCGLEKSIVF